MSPVFTATQKALLKGSVDFFAVNHYTSTMVVEGAQAHAVGPLRDSNVTWTKVRSLPRGCTVCCLTRILWWEHCQCTRCLCIMEEGLSAAGDTWTNSL